MVLKAKPSIRYCLVCERNTEWKIDYLIGHSKCCICGADSKFAKKPQLKDEFGVLINTKNKNINNLQNITFKKIIKKRNEEITEKNNEISRLYLLNKKLRQENHNLLMQVQKLKKELKTKNGE